MGDLFQKVRAFLVAVLVAPVKLYQRYISPGLPPRCRYYPSCSNYAVEALQTYGPAKGLVLGTWRVLRCNPWSRGGVDHVPEKGRWKAPVWVPPDDWAGHDIEEGATGALNWLRKKSVADADDSDTTVLSQEELDKKES